MLGEKVYFSRQIYWNEECQSTFYTISKYAALIYWYEKASVKVGCSSSAASSSAWDMHDGAHEYTWCAWTWWTLASSAIIFMHGKTKAHYFPPFWTNSCRKHLNIPSIGWYWHSWNIIYLRHMFCTNIFELASFYLSQSHPNFEISLSEI